MKKILFILLLVLPALAYSATITLNLGTMVAADTTIYIPTAGLKLVTFDFTRLSGNTAVLEVGCTDRTLGFTRFDENYTYTLSKVTYTNTDNGYVRNRIAKYSTTGFPGTYFAFKVTKNSNTGILLIEY
jgi:hypothetical protein